MQRATKRVAGRVSTHVPPSDSVQRVLHALAQGPMPKNKLAVATFGRADNSSRVRTTKLTGTLRKAGFISERAIGRERLVELTDRGRAELKKLPSTAGVASPGPAVPDLIKAVTVEREHGDDRVRFHLRHAAMLALLKLRAQPKRTMADDHMEGVLTALVDEKTNPLEDRQLFESLRSSWGGGPRKRLMEALVMFENPDERRRTGIDLLALGEKMTPGVDAILWASAAIDLAHLYSFAPATQVERLTARRLLHMAKSLMINAQHDPDLATAATYRLAKIGKVGAVGWSWSSPVPAREHVLTGDKEHDALVTSLAEVEDKVRQAGKFNQALEDYDLALARHIGRWVMTAMPSSDWVFRRVGGVGIGKAIEDWANAIRASGSLTELLTTQAAADPELREALRTFLAVAPDFESSFGSVVQPHVAQAKALLGEPVTAPSTPYESQLLNNQWTPEMVAVDAIVPMTA